MGGGDAAAGVVLRSTTERGEVVLRRRGYDGALELRVNGVFVMDDRESRAERLLAARALAALAGRPAQPVAVLVAGLGLGATLAEVLRSPLVGTVTVVELEEGLVGWHRTGAVPGSPVGDPRVRLEVGDVRDVIPTLAAQAYDVVLLDVDNGPDHLVYDANAEVYAGAFLRQCRRVTRSGGVTAIWSADESAELGAALGAVFDRFQVVDVPVLLGNRATSYWLYLGFRAAG